MTATRIVQTLICAASCQSQPAPTANPKPPRAIFLALPKRPRLAGIWLLRISRSAIDRSERLEGELTRARAHENSATNLLKDVIEIGERVGEVHRTIQRIRVEGLAERRKMIERYYSEEARKYSLVVKALEAQEAALSALDVAISAHKAELEASRARLEAMVAEAQAAEDALIAEIEQTREALGADEEAN